MTEPERAKTIGGYGQPFYAPFWWPIINILALFKRSSTEVPGIFLICLSLYRLHQFFRITYFNLV